MPPGFDEHAPPDSACPGRAQKPILSMPEATSYVVLYCYFLYTPKKPDFMLHGPHC